MRLLRVSALIALLLAAPATAAQINIPTNTWVAIPYPASRTACDDGICKHERLAHNSTNGRIYWLGGDHDNGPGWTQSGSNEMWSYSILENDWRLETPYCLGPGLLQPAHPDEVGFAYDSRRNRFWLYPGYMGVAGTCTSVEVGHKPMAFDVGTGLWSDPNLPWTYTTVRFSQYDPAGDRTLSLEYAGDTVIEHNLATGVVRRVNTIIPSGQDGGNTFFAPAYTALDVQGQGLYVLSGDRGKLYRYDLVTNEFRYVTQTPVAPPFPVEQQLFWDPGNKVLLWPYRAPRGSNDIQGQFRCFVWHQSTNLWEEIPMTPPRDMQGNLVLDGSGNPVQIKGRQGVFDPLQNAMLITGMDSADPVPYIFLYRYGQGQIDTVAPSVPANLMAR